MRRNYGSLNLAAMAPACSMPAFDGDSDDELAVGCPLEQLTGADEASDRRPRLRSIDAETPAHDLPVRIQQQHASELHALRCLSLKMMMLSASTAANTSSSPVVSAPIDPTESSVCSSLPTSPSWYGTSSADFERKAPMLRIRRASLHLNVIQSV